MALNAPHLLPVLTGKSRSVLALLPACWSKVLFPGRSRATEPAQLSSILLLLVLPGLLLYPCLSFHLFEPDEGRYAEIPREMLDRGSWVVPYLQGEPYLDKPPLFYWLVMLSYSLFGVHVWAARLVPALAIHAGVLLTYTFGRRNLGERAAFWGSLFLGVAPGFLSIGRLLVLDGVLTFWVTLSLFSAFEAVNGERLRRGWWLLAALGTGLGVLTKGPVAFLLLAPPLAAFLWFDGSRPRPTLRDSGLFFAVVLAVTLPWYVAASVVLPGFPRYFFWEHNIVRFLAPFAHQEPVWFYGPVILGGLLPATLLLPGFLRFLLSGEEAKAQQRCAALGFLLLAGIWCVLFFSLSDCKLPTYIMPAFPPLMLALGYGLIHSRWAASRWPAVAVALTLSVIGVAHFWALPVYAQHRSPVGKPGLVERYCADRNTPVVCYPRGWDSVAFHLRRDDLHNFRSKETPEMISFLFEHKRTVILFTHRHSLEALRRVLPAQLRIVEEVPMCGSAKPGPEGMCYLAVIEKQ